MYIKTSLPFRQESSANEALLPALKSVEGVARQSILKPMMNGVAHSLEVFLSKIHDDHFGEGATEVCGCAICLVPDCIVPMDEWE